MVPWLPNLFASRLIKESSSRGIISFTSKHSIPRDRPESGSGDFLAQWNRRASGRDIYSTGRAGEINHGFLRDTAFFLSNGMKFNFGTASGDLGLTTCDFVARHLTKIIDWLLYIYAYYKKIDTCNAKSKEYKLLHHL